MSRRERKNRNPERGISIIAIWSVVAVAIIAFVLAYVLYSRKIENQKLSLTDNNQKVSETNDTKMINMVSTENTEQASSSIGKTTNEMENQETTKMAVNTSKIEQEESQNNENKSIEENQISKDDKNQEVPATEEEQEEPATKEDPTFIKPIEGEILKDYSKDNLIYSSTLDEWTTHLGIDIKAEKTDVVKAAADGTIKSIKNDPRYGLTVVIEHDNGFESIYSSLLTSEFVKVGEKVTQGQTIATVGNTATFEVKDETHLHFEIKKDGENVDPNIYIK